MRRVTIFVLFMLVTLTWGTTWLAMRIAVWLAMRIAVETIK